MKTPECQSKWVENTVGKGEIALSPFPTVFSKDLYCRQGLVRERVNQFGEKAENWGNHYLLLFPQCFVPYQRQKSTVW